MKISLLNDSFPPVIDGVANVVMNYAKIFTEKGEDVLVATPHYPDAKYDEYPYSVVDYKSYDIKDFVGGYRAGNPFDMSAVEKMTAFKPEIIHTHCPVASTIMARLLRNEIDVPLIFTYHTKFDVEIARAVKAKFLQAEGAKLLVDNISACDEVWTVSNGAGKNLQELGYQGDYRVVSNGVDFEKGKVDEDIVFQVTSKYDLPDDVPMFLFVGRLMNYKGLPIIINAMSQLSKEGYDFRMVFVGGGSDAESLKNMAAELDLNVDIKNDDGDIISFSTSDKPGKLIFTGPEHDRTALRAWNTRAWLFLFPSTYDTNGIVVREAAACGLASVLIKDSCAAEGITDRVNGYTIEETPEAMAALLKELGNNKETVKKAGERAMDEIYISWKDAVYEAYDRYQVLIDDKKCGKIPPVKKERSDYLLKFTSSLAVATDKVFNVPRSIKYGMMENMTEVIEELYDKKNFITGQLQEKKDSLVDHLQKKRNSIGESFKEKSQILRDRISG
ncbi:MAG: glycosyltransferase [Lachnospiraceae bacterium]|nr:glycosyltransferase [Lachnospiraceae bacterium]